MKVRAAGTFGLGSDYYHPGFVITDNTNFRYFKADLSNSVEGLLYLDSKVNKANGIDISDLNEKLDREFGLMEWKVIGYQKTLYILVPEIFIETKMKTFLELSDSIFKKLT